MACFIQCRIDAHPELFYTQGEAWTFAMVERADPGLFKHKPQGYFPGAVVADQGSHRFRFRFFLEAPAVEMLAGHALAMHRPPLTAEPTRGMKALWTEYRSATDILK